MATIEELRSEVERLTRELDLQSSEINQSAKYGLGLLEEKLALQSKCEELENLYENTKHDLEITHEVRKIALNCFTISISLPHIGSSSYDQFLNIQQQIK
jgi:chromosome segregation ATPase